MGFRLTPLARDTKVNRGYVIFCQTVLYVYCLYYKFSVCYGCAILELYLSPYFRNLKLRSENRDNSTTSILLYSSTSIICYMVFLDCFGYISKELMRSNFNGVVKRILYTMGLQMWKTVVTQ